MKLKYIIPILILFASSCEQQHIQKSLKKYEIEDPIVTIDTTDEKQYIAILKDKNAEEILPIKQSEFDTLDVLLKECIEKYNLTHDEKINLQYYKRQYITSINEKGEKIVWINCFCRVNKNEYWKINIFMVDDGGDCFFNLKINLKEKKYFEFYVNGDA